jgi:hypothetical protein
MLQGDINEWIRRLHFSEINAKQWRLLSIYKNALDFIFEKEDIKNMGHCGIYHTNPDQ